MTVDGAKVRAAADMIGRVEALIAPVLGVLGYELWRVAWQPGQHTLQVMAERGDGVGMRVEDCVTITHAISPALDVADIVPGQYSLEVSSPGIDRPLVRGEHFARYAGHAAKIETALPVDERRRFRGRILAADAQAVRIETESGEVTLPLANIRAARLVEDEGRKKPRH